MTPLRVVPVALALLLVLVGTGAGAPTQRLEPTPGGGGAGDPYFPADGNGGFDVRHYDVRVRMMMRRQRLFGNTRIQAVAKKDLSRFNLDLLLGVRSVRVNGVPARFTKTNRHELQVTPRKPIAKGERFTVRVVYAGRPARIRWAGERSWVGNRQEVVAMGQPHIAAFWFPGSDHPSDKARFDIRIRVPKGMQGIANGRLVSRTPKARLTTWHWRAKEPMTSYLAFFAAGKFRLERGRTADGLPWVYAVSRRLNQTQQTRALRMLRTTPRVLRELESWLGDYPFSVTGGLVTSVGVGFALENQTRPTYPYVGGRESEWLVAHELAHQWFGDLVAIRGWRDIWVNEGLASYMELLNDGWGFRRPGAWLRHAWRSSDLNWRIRIGNPGRGHIFHDAVYDRGAMTVQALRNRIGDRDFKELLRTWVQDRSHGSNAEFAELAEQISGEDLDSFFRAWLYTGKRPKMTETNGWR